MSSNYPNAIDSYTEKHDGVGNFLSASHINVLQEAIVAIETELKINHNSNLNVHPLNSILATDHSASGLKSSLTFGESITFGQLLYQNSNGKLLLADADLSTTMPGICLALEIGIDTNIKSVLFTGFIKDNSWSWTVGGLIYASCTPGGLTQTAPAGSADQVQVVGIATHSTKIFFNPNYILIEIS